MKRILLLATALLSTWSAASLLEAGDWPGWRGPQRTDVSSETGLLKSWGDKGPRKVWSYENAGLGYGGPAKISKGNSEEAGSKQVIFKSTAINEETLDDDNE